MRRATYRRNYHLPSAFVVLVVGLISATLLRSAPEGSSGSPLQKVADVPMPGPAVRFDYLDASQGRLYLAHMNANQLVVFDVRKREVIANLDGFPSVHGVWAVPELAEFTRPLPASTKWRLLI